jgi:hypothetical protein
MNRPDSDRGGNLFLGEISMMPWKKMILPAVIALAVPVWASADTGCASGDCGKGGHGHGGHGGHVHGLFQFLEETNEAPNFRPRGSLVPHFAGGRFAGGAGGAGYGGFGGPGGMGGAGLGYGQQVAGHGLLQPPFQAAPWYLYWPYDAHFQLPAPVNAPYYPPQAYGYPGAYNPYFGGSAPPGWTGIPAGYIPGTPSGAPAMALPGAPPPRISVQEPALIAPLPTDKK